MFVCFAVDCLVLRSGLAVVCYYCLFCACVLALTSCVGWFSVGVLDLGGLGIILLALSVVVLSGLVFWLWWFVCLGSWFVLGCVGWVFWLGGFGLVVCYCCFGGFGGCYDCV